jgi:hypothetical protein
MSSLLEQLIPVSQAGTPETAAKPTTFHRRPGVTAFLEERFLVPAYSSPRAPLWIAAHQALSIPLQMQGTVRHYAAHLEGRELRVVGIGRRKRFHPLLQRLFGQVRELDAAGTRRLLSPAGLEGIHADLVMAEVNRTVASRFRDAGWLLMPDSVRWTGETAMLPPPVPSHSLKEDYRKLRRHDYTLTQTTDWRLWQEFYETMLVPQAVSRFGEAAWLPSRHFIAELAARGVLHMLSQNGRWVAAICSVRHGDTLWLPLSGVLNGDSQLLRQGVSVAVFTSIFRWAREQGAVRIDAGRTTPFLNDGIPRSKSKWGLRPVLDPLSHLVALRFDPTSPVGAEFAAHSILVESAEGLKPTNSPLISQP